MDVSVNSVNNGGQQRHKPGFAAFTGNAQQVVVVDVADVERQGFGNTQAAAVEQGKNRGVAPSSPGFGTEFRGGVQNVKGFVNIERFGQDFGQTRRTDDADGGILSQVVPVQPAEKLRTAESSRASEVFSRFLAARLLM